MPPYKTKRHLGRGKHYGFWQIRQGKQEVHYFDPDLVCLKFTECCLRNQYQAALKTYTGERNKQPCAWIISQTWQILPESEYQRIDLSNPIYYSPRTAPYWRNASEENIDGLETAEIITWKCLPYIQPAKIEQPSLF